MDLLKLSKFKLQLHALITEVRDLRQKERSSSVQSQILIQKQKQNEEEFSRKLKDLEAELASSIEIRQKLERKARELQDDNSFLEDKQKELKATLNCLLLSKESFVKSYEDSTCAMKRAIEHRDRKISVLSEKINAHQELVNSIEKELSYVKQVVDDTQRVLNEKEEVATGLKMKLEKVSTFEKLFIEKITDLERKLRADGDEFQRRDRIIAELEIQLETAKIGAQCHPQIEMLQENLNAKEGIIQNLISENKALHFELGSLHSIVKKIQQTVTHMNEENRVAFFSVQFSPEEHATTSKKDDNRTNEVQNCAISHGEAIERRVEGITASPRCYEKISISSCLRVNNNFSSCVSESACSPPHSACSEPQPAANSLCITREEAKGYENQREATGCNGLAQQLDSECSTTR